MGCQSTQDIFRELPVPILNQVKTVVIEKSQTCEDVQKVVTKEFPEPAQSILIWLWDLCVEVAEHQATNKMTPQNLAIVIGPNLFNTTSFQNPMAAMTFSGKVVVFFQRGIEWRIGIAHQKKEVKWSPLDSNQFIFAELFLQKE